MLDWHYAGRGIVLGPAAGMRGGESIKSQLWSATQASGYEEISRYQGVKGRCCGKAPKKLQRSELWSMQNDRAGEVQKSGEQVCLLLLLLLLLIDT